MVMMCIGSMHGDRHTRRTVQRHPSMVLFLGLAGKIMVTCSMNSSAWDFLQTHSTD